MIRQKLKGIPIKNFNYFPMTYTLIIINVVIFILPLLGFDKELIYKFGVNYAPSVIIQGEVWRLFTSMFLHADAMHLTLNMVSLYLLGQAIEPIFPRWIYGMLYFISGLFGGLVSLYFHFDAWGLGASGAIFGLFGVLVGFAILHRDRMGESFKQFIKQIVIILGINLVFGLVVPNVDMSAHIGGLVVGFIGGLMVGKNLNAIWVFTLLILIGMGIFYEYLESLYVYPTTVLYGQ